MNAEAVREAWADRSGEFSPGYYAYRGPDETSEAVRRALEDLVGSDASVCELGCSAGRHLAHLHANGFEELHGVDVNGAALDVMAAEYPGLAEVVTFHHESIERAVEDFPAGGFDAVFSVETLQHVHDDESWVFPALAALAGTALLTVECERSRDGNGEPSQRLVDDDLPLYYRAWDEVFSEAGLVEVRTRQLGRDTLRAFVHG